MGDDEGVEGKPGGRGSTRTQGWVLLLTMCAAGIGGTFQYGYNLTIINAPTLHIQKFVNETWLERTGWVLDSGMITLIWSVVVSVYPLGGFLGALLAGPMAIKLGRKKSLLFNNLFVLLSAILCGFSRFAQSFEMIVLGRILAGVNSGKTGQCVSGALWQDRWETAQSARGPRLAGTPGDQIHHALTATLRLRGCVARGASPQRLQRIQGERFNLLIATSGWNTLHRNALLIPERNLKPKLQLLVNLRIVQTTPPPPPGPGLGVPEPGTGVTRRTQ
ncbi:solute carrier family 2, facilitated glucose transporter member 5-like [Ascaphus truei]|uniref:solute carrier family 2, facilitated glucose transporter member 5-like n=1 Tax=Ascaphus truei TaxID=8439 RepID=UPI003F5933AE